MPADPVAGLAAELSGLAGAEVELERPGNPQHGDYATNVALRLARAERRPPRELAEELAGADRVVMPYATAGRVMANLVLKPQVTAFLDTVMTAEGDDFRLEEIEVTGTCARAGRTLRDLRVREETGAMIVAVRKPDGRFDTTPDPEELIEVGDVLIAAGTTEELSALEEIFAPREALTG